MSHRLELSIHLSVALPSDLDTNGKSGVEAIGESGGIAGSWVKRSIGHNPSNVHSGYVSFHNIRIDSHACQMKCSPNLYTLI